MSIPEAQARIAIDRQLELAGWVVQNRGALNLWAATGVAVREVQLATGAADYLLFVERKAVGAIEAKKIGTPLSGVEAQSAAPQGLAHAAALPLRKHRRRDLLQRWARPRPALAARFRFPSSRDAAGLGAGAGFLPRAFAGVAALDSHGSLARVDRGRHQPPTICGGKGSNTSTPTWSASPPRLRSRRWASSTRTWRWNTRASAP